MRQALLFIGGMAAIFAIVPLAVWGGTGDWRKALEAAKGYGWWWAIIGAVMALAWAWAQVEMWFGFTPT